MKVIGLTGCAGSGKSYVSECIRTRLGFPVIDSDSECKQLMGPGMAVTEEIFKIFGNEYKREDGSLDRALLAKTVFANEDALETLNAITHPATIERICSMLKAEEQAGTPVVFVESALAEQAGYRTFCDELWLVYASEEARRQRLRDTRGYDEERIHNLIQSQTPQGIMMNQCDRVIVNDVADAEAEILRQLQFHLESIGFRD